MQSNNAQVKEGILRQMTLGEIAMAHTVFCNAIAYSRVWVHCDSYFPFGMQKPGYAVAPNGELRYRKEGYPPDFSGVTMSLVDKPTFIHEQASIIADYWLLLVYGISAWRNYQAAGGIGKYRGTDKLRDIPARYQKIVIGQGGIIK